MTGKRKKTVIGDDDDCCYSDEDVSDSQENSAADYDHESFLEEKDDGAVDSNKVPLKSYRMLNQGDLRTRMADDIAELSTVLSITKPEASIILRNYNWSVSKVTDAWFADENRVREKVGFLEETGEAKQAREMEIRCGICFESYSGDEIKRVSCGHPYCNDCWSMYISTSINNDGPRCLFLRCPEPSCPAVVGKDLIDLLVSFADRKKYEKLVIESYVEHHNRRTKWCPGVSCDNAVEILDEDGCFDVVCDCLTSFCFNCYEEGHRPVDCETVKKWILKNSSEAENVNYILAYCKPCPKCKRPIEKNQGCMAMRCRVCNHSFCWMCLRPNVHHYACNSYPDSKSSSDEKRKNMAKESIEKYTHYFERWDSNRKSKLKALQDYQKLENEQFKNLSSTLGIPEARLEFITKAWQQIVECRRSLEWSYAYGFFLDDPVKKQFFEYVQGEAESGLEKLHHMAETGLQQFLPVPDDDEDDDNNTNGDDGSMRFDEMKMKNFDGFQSNLSGLTIVTENYFEKLNRALEKGLTDVETDYWACDLCTFFNPSYTKVCGMCELPVEDSP